MITIALRSTIIGPRENPLGLETLIVLNGPKGCELTLDTLSQEFRFRYLFNGKGPSIIMKANERDPTYAVLCDQFEQHVGISPQEAYSRYDKSCEQQQGK